MWVEAPEARASTLLLGGQYRVHIRVHCPSSLAQYHNGDAVDWDLHSAERRVVMRANFVSAPSRTMAGEVAAWCDRQDIGVFPNPVRVDPATPGGVERDIDVLFLGRSQRLKGLDLFRDALRFLPASFRVVVAGAGLTSEDWSGARCDVTVLEPVGTGGRDVLLARACVVALPSRFESFSMVGAEAMAAGVPVVAWEDSAASELGPPPFVCLVPNYCPREFAKALVRVSESRRHSTWRVNEHVQLAQDYSSRFVAGIRHLYKTGVASRLGASAPDYRLEHGNYRQRPHVLPRLSHRSTQFRRIKTDRRVFRKLRKLRTKPYAFVRDSKLANLFVRVSRASSTELRDANGVRDRACVAGVILPGAGGPRFVGKGLGGWGDRVPLLWADCATSTAERGSDALGSTLLRRCLADEQLFPQPHNSLRCLVDLGVASNWSRSLIPQKALRNGEYIVFVNPTGGLAENVRRTATWLRSILVIDDSWDESQAVPNPLFDAVIAVGTVAARRAEGYYCGTLRVVEQPDQIPVLLAELLARPLVGKSDVLLPAFGTSGLLGAQLESWNRSSLDGILEFKTNSVPRASMHLQDLDDPFSAVRWLLLRESHLRRYGRYSEGGDERNLLHVCIRDGLDIACIVSGGGGTGRLIVNRRTCRIIS